MISDLIRTLLSFLSSWYPNSNISKEKDGYLRYEILKRIDKIKVNNQNLQKTHKNFNKKILKLLKDKELKNFLRKNFIQKMFFLQNRFFIYQELKVLKKSKKWNFYEKLLGEDSIGNPIRFFLYLRSSGNRINHIYQLNILSL